MPFAAGPRSCLGQPLAHIVLRSVLARLVDRYEFRDARLDTESDIKSLRKDMQAGFTVLPQGGVEVQVRMRLRYSS
jgi:cytochrome P450